MTILKSICLIFLYEHPPFLSVMCSNDDDDADGDDEIDFLFQLTAFTKLVK